jgi:hypothetical protein
MLLSRPGPAGLQDAVRTGTGLMHGIPVALGVMDFGYMGGSMGSVSDWAGDVCACLCHCLFKVPCVWHGSSSSRIARLSSDQDAARALSSRPASAFAS